MLKPNLCRWVNIVFGVTIYTNTGDFKNAVATIKNNTIMFTWGFKEPGKGAYDGACIRVNGPTNITGNILAHSDSNSIYATYSSEKISLTKNVFHQNLYSPLLQLPEPYSDGFYLRLAPQGSGTLTLGAPPSGPGTVTAPLISSARRAADASTSPAPSPPRSAGAPRSAGSTTACARARSAPAGRPPGRTVG